MTPPLIVLPGLDGTGDLLVPFAEASGARVVTYPPDRALSLDEYVELAAREVDGEAVVIAESFSGPVALRLAKKVPLAALVLVGTFVTPPLPRMLRWLPLSLLARLDVPDRLLAWWMLAPFSTPERLRAIRDALGRVDPEVVASRMRIALSVDEREPLRRTRMPLLDLRGSDDRLVWGDQRGRMRAARPDVTAITVEGPHALLFTRPGEAWEAMRGWVASVRLRESGPSKPRGPFQ